MIKIKLKDLIIQDRQKQIEFKDSTTETKNKDYWDNQIVLLKEMIR